MTILVWTTLLWSLSFVSAPDRDRLLSRIAQLERMQATTAMYSKTETQLQSLRDEFTKLGQTGVCSGTGLMMEIFPAEIVRIGPTWVVSVGSLQGLADGDAVLHQGSLVGFLEVVGRTHSLVRPLTRRGSQILVEISQNLQASQSGQTRELAVLEGTGSEVWLRYLEQSQELQEGGLVSSAIPASSGFPLVIGRVRSSDRTPQGMFWSQPIDLLSTPPDRGSVVVVPYRTDSSELGVSPDQRDPQGDAQ